MFRPDCSLSAFCLLCFSLLHRQKGAGNLPGGCPQSTVDKSIFWCQSSASPLGSFEDGLLHMRDWAGFGSAGSREAVQQIWRCGGVGSSAFGSLQRGWGWWVKVSEPEESFIALLGMWAMSCSSWGITFQCALYPNAAGDKCWNCLDCRRWGANTGSSVLKKYL